MPKKSSFLDEIIKQQSSCTMEIVCLDIVGYSQRTSACQHRIINALSIFIRQAFDDVDSRFRHKLGRNKYPRDLVVASTGDGALVGFPFGPGVGLHFAQAVMRLLASHNAEEVRQRKIICAQNPDSFKLRCGISFGDAIVYADINNIYNMAGDSVNKAARICDRAAPSSILLSDQMARRLLHLRDTEYFNSDFYLHGNLIFKHGCSEAVSQYIRPGHAGVDFEPGLRQDEPTGTCKASTSPISVPNGEMAQVRIENTLDCLESRLVTVTPSQYLMGDDRYGRVQVTFSGPFQIDRECVTQELYEFVMGAAANPSLFKGHPRRPVERVSWKDAVDFCIALSLKCELEPVYQTGRKITADFSKNGYRLPTEAEWEFCCLAGGDTYVPLESHAWFARNANGETHDVGLGKPNSLGLVDMLGNVREWCHDWFAQRFPDWLCHDFAGPDIGCDRVLRGGSWRDQPQVVDGRYRFKESALVQEGTNGFRIVRRLPS